MSHPLFTVQSTARAAIRKPKLGSEGMTYAVANGKNNTDVSDGEQKLVCFVRVKQKRRNGRGASSANNSSVDFLLMLLID